MEKLLQLDGLSGETVRVQLARERFALGNPSAAGKILGRIASTLEASYGGHHHPSAAEIRRISKALTDHLILFPKDPRDLINPNLELALDRWITGGERYIFGEGNRDKYTQSHIDVVAIFLEHLRPEWSQISRTYIILRKIGRLDLLPSLLEIGFSDFLIPAAGQILPKDWSPDIRKLFLDAQEIVLSDEVPLGMCHHNFGASDLVPVQHTKRLGEGGHAEIDQVVTKSGKEFARKLIHRHSSKQGVERAMSFISEIKLLQRLRHRHVVQLFGSYSDPDHIAFLMTPVAHTDLGAYLSEFGGKDPDLHMLRSFFGCLAGAIAFMHENRVRHKDIKPKNVLIYYKKAYLADFGLSLDFAETGNSTTVDRPKSWTARYAAPEAADYQPRNRKTDIWSLGLTFMEMFVVLRGSTVAAMDSYFGQRQKITDRHLIRDNMDALPAFLSDLRALESTDNLALEWIEPMLQPSPALRPDASILFERLRNTPDFCAICCSHVIGS